MKVTTRFVLGFFLISFILASCSLVHTAQAKKHLSQGMELEQQGQLQLAMDEYSLAIELDPTLALAFYQRGSAHAALEDYIQAVDDLDQVLALDPEHAEAFNLRGLACIKLEEFDRAIEDLNKAIELQALIVPR